MQGSSQNQHLKIEHIRVRRGCLDLQISCSLENLHVTHDQAVRVLGLLPNLQNHVCVNGAGETLGDELIGTELPHLLEHVIIELQGKACGASARFTGHTSWLDELANTAPGGYALMRTTVGFSNDFVALRAARDACVIIEWMIDPESYDVPDIDSIVNKLISQAQ